MVRECIIEINRQVVGCVGDDMRIVKEAEERRNEILDVAEELFASKGYDKTSTGDILERIGIARGTLYYHFRSKEDILDAMIERISGTLIAKAKAEAAKKDVPVIDRICNAIMSLNIESKIGTEVLNQVHKPQNALLHQKMQKNLVDDVVPVLAKLVEEGVAHGIFHTDYPMEATKMLVVYSSEAFDDREGLSDEELMIEVRAFIYNVERVLGAASGTLTEPMMKLFV